MSEVLLSCSEYSQMKTIFIIDLAVLYFKNSYRLIG